MAGMNSEAQRWADAKRCYWERGFVEGAYFNRPGYPDLAGGASVG